MCDHARRHLLALTCSAAIDLTRHRVCCRIPSWTAYVGQPWRPFDEEMLNLYNLWWCLGQRVANAAECPCRRPSRPT